MNAEEEKQIETLLAKASSPAQQKDALIWMKHYLEEGDILNLPASKRTLDALETFSKRSSADSVLRSRAGSLLKQSKRM